MSQNPNLPITSLALLVSDIERSKRFYNDLLGFEQISQNGSCARLATPGANLTLLEVEYFENKLGIKAGRIEGSCRQTMIAFHMASRKDVDEVCSRFAAHGLKFIALPKMFEWNAYAAYILDPDGNFVEVFSWHDDGPLDVVNKSDAPRFAECLASRPLTITSVCLFVRNLKQCLEYYSRALEMKATRLDIEGGFANFSGTGSDFSMWDLEWTENSIGYKSAKLISPYQGVVINCQVPSIDAVESKYEELRHCEIEIISPPEVRDWGDYSVFLSDPEGNLWSIFTPNTNT